jgi:hypothetical protein
MTRLPAPARSSELPNRLSREGPKDDMEASVAIMHIAFGPPSPEANEELAVWLEAAGVDVDKMRKEVAETLATLRLWN